MATTTRLLYGQATAATAPLLWADAPVSTDGGVPFALRVRTRAVAPTGAGGECVFWRATLVVTASMSVTLRVTPLVDTDAATATPLVTPVGTIDTLAPSITLPQAAASAEGYPRTTYRLTVPLVRRRCDALGVEQERWALRGAQLAFRIDTVGALGTGELRLDGIELEFSPVLKGRYERVVT